MYIKFLTFFILISTSLSCTSGKLIRQYKSPDTDSFLAAKVLVVGIHSNLELRSVYEKKMVESLEKEDVNAVKSVDFFEKSFTNNKKSISELNEIENQLLAAGFDAVLFTKITGNNTRVTLVDAYKNFAKSYQSFEDYYYSNQNLYLKEEKLKYQVYFTETSLFCICPGKERELLWTGDIEVIDGTKMQKNINAYTKVLFNILTKNNLLFIKE